MGKAALGDYEPIPAGPELLNHWLHHPRLRKAERNILSHLASIYPTGDNQGGAGTGHRVRIDRWRLQNALSRLRTLELVSRLPDGRIAGQRGADGMIFMRSRRSQVMTGVNGTLSPTVGTTGSFLTWCNRLPRRSACRYPDTLLYLFRRSRRSGGIASSIGWPSDRTRECLLDRADRWMFAALPGARGTAVEATL